MKKLAVLGSMLLAISPAFAQTLTPPTNESPSAAHAPPTHASAMKARARPAPPMNMEDRVNQRITTMHQRLRITSTQQPAWDAFAEVMRGNMTSIEQAYKARRASVTTMSAPDNMRNFAQIEQGRADGIQKLAASFQGLYDGMSDDQKKTADAMFSHYGDRGAMQRRQPR